MTRTIAHRLNGAGRLRFDVPWSHRGAKTAHVFYEAGMVHGRGAPADVVAIVFRATRGGISDPERVARAIDDHIATYADAVRAAVGVVDTEIAHLAASWSCDEDERPTESERLDWLREAVLALAGKAT